MSWLENLWTWLFLSRSWLTLTEIEPVGLCANILMLPLRCQCWSTFLYTSSPVKHRLFAYSPASSTIILVIICCVSVWYRPSGIGILIRRCMTAVSRYLYLDKMSVSEKNVWTPTLVIGHGTWIVAPKSQKRSNGVRLCSSLREKMRSLFAVAVRLSVCVCLSSVVYNVRAPYSGGSNFRLYFYGVMYLGHPLTSTDNFTEIVPGELLCLGS